MEKEHEWEGRSTAHATRSQAEASACEASAASADSAAGGASQSPYEWNEVRSGVPQTRERQPKQLSRLSRSSATIAPLQPRLLPEEEEEEEEERIAQGGSAATGGDWLSLDMEDTDDRPPSEPDGVELQWVAYALNYICLAKARRGLITAEAQVRQALDHEDFSRFYGGLTLNDFFTDIVVMHGVQLHAQAPPVDLAVLPHSHPYLQWLDVCDREERGANAGTAIGGQNARADAPASRCILGQFECFTQPGRRRQSAPVALPEQLALVELAHVDALIDHIVACTREVYGVDVAGRHSGTP